ncbi:SH3 type 3 domain protein [Paludibacter propionicigenes WB4]|uniref:SH3 type 3 domain protein n=1 Tax=Paludibacter propionicigenes (strain DSM 17365 / JCM 13257 / WB4) TaxID=694427 RepID=E4T854_PALPW|nr:DUF3761 domain-containing protein [Paludibacter propionicigenes]ADQ80898.1 SH3 type 3 domain protein [Paludibacter propionicigenes WB4]
MKKKLLLFVNLLIVFSAIAQNSVRYTTVRLNLREDANASSNVIAVLPRGTVVNVAKECDCAWILVSYEGKEGYVSSKYLSYTQPAQTKHSIVKHQQRTKYYINSAGERVQSPTHYQSVPAGATALCWDGTYSFSQSRRGTCSHHGGVKIWL